MHYRDIRPYRGRFTPMGSTAVTAILTDEKGNARWVSPKKSTDHYAVSGILVTALAGIIGELVIPNYDEYVDAATTMSESVDGCTLATVGIGVNVIVEVTSSM